MYTYTYVHVRSFGESVWSCQSEHISRGNPKNIKMPKPVSPEMAEVFFSKVWPTSFFSNFFQGLAQDLVQVQLLVNSNLRGVVFIQAIGEVQFVELGLRSSCW